MFGRRLLTVGGGTIVLAGIALAASAAAPAQSPPAAAAPGEATEVQPVARRRVSSAAELNEVLRSGFQGRVIVPRDASFDMTGYAFYGPIPLGSGVELVGERGVLGSRPLLYTLDRKAAGEGDPRKSATYALFEVKGNDVRVEGLHLRGPWPAKDHKKHVVPEEGRPYTHGIRVIENAEERLGRRVVVADNEFEQWSGGGVYAVGPRGSKQRSEWKPEWQHLGPRDAGLVRVERNYFHHNVMDGGGYGVVVGGDAYVTVEGNVFDYNRHAVAASGRAHSGYVARFNYVLQGGYKQHARGRPDFHNQHFDVHGELRGGYGGYAGTYFEIALNTIRGEQRYGLGTKVRPAFMLRGKPTRGAFFRGNVVVHDDLGEAVSLKPGKIPRAGDYSKKLNFHAGGNRFDTDHSAELASGDFDGDGRSDVFVATGTAWFFSRAGIRPWEYLRPSDKRTGELGFADIDNDGTTDVLWRDGAGRVGYVKSGWLGYTVFTSTPVAMKDLRFGDFDGDGLTDIFSTRGGQWSIWYGRSRSWTPAQTSSFPVSALLFGEFDDVAGTDVVAVTGGGWSYSSGATQPWAKLNAGLVRSFQHAVAADFDGNGTSDVAYSDGRRWLYSADGRSPAAVLRQGSGSLRDVLVDRFDGGTRALALTFLGDSERLSAWRGPGSGSAFVIRSAQNMR